MQPQLPKKNMTFKDNRETMSADRLSDVRVTTKSFLKHFYLGMVAHACNFITSFNLGLRPAWTT